MTSPSAMYIQVLKCLDRDLGDDERALPLLSATTLSRHWELLDPRTVISGGQLHVPKLTFNNRPTVARINDLPETFAAEVGERTGTVIDLLGLPGRFIGEVLESHRIALSEIEIAAPVTLESLPALHLAALIEMAPSADHREAAIAAAGIRATTPTAMRRRHALSAETIAWVAECTNGLLNEALGTPTAEDIGTERALR